MVCKKCGNIVVKTETCCKICGEPILPEAINKSLERQSIIAEKISDLSDEINKEKIKKRYRSRVALLFIFWIGGYLGLHHAWMGDAESAVYEGKKFIKHFLLCFVGVGIPLIMIDLVKFVINFFAIAFGKYDTDYNGNPIVWSKANKPTLD